jgi:hypothetical protein
MEYIKSHTRLDSRTSPNWPTLGQDVKNILILNQYVKNDTNPKPKCSSQNLLWFGFIFCGLGSNTRPKHMDFYLMFLFLWSRVISHHAQGHLAYTVCKTFIVKFS